MKKYFDFTDKHRQLILDSERYIWKNPETGYKEFKTSAYMEKIFTDLGYDITKADGITGFYTVIDTGRPGPTLLVLGELDSIICPAHPESDPNTGAVHSCGHNAQSAALIGVAAALKEEGALDGLCGKIMLCSVPAEELLEIEYRMELIKEGKIKYFGGKTEYLYRGYFDGVDLAFMMHTSSHFALTGGSVGCIAKKITYKGVAAHAGGSPWAGKNALYAATCGINAANAIRETFEEADIIRFHPIITNGGSMVNAIPETVTMESYVRGSSFDGIGKSNKRINKALIGAALSMDVNVDITDMPGYAPLVNDKTLTNIAKEVFEETFPDKEIFVNDKMGSGSTDMGDLSCVMPVIHAYAGGAVGRSHGNNYYIENPEDACVNSAKWQLALIHALLKDNAAKANEVINNSVVPFKNKEEYFSHFDSLCSSGDRIVYSDDKAEVTLK